MNAEKLKLAVFIDFDNIEIGVKTTLNQSFDIGAVLEAIKERGEVVTKVAYGDWKRSGDHGRAMAQHAVRMVQRVMTPGGDKNGADINLALDALEMAFTHAHINAFVIVGGDSDFITLVEKLKQYDRKVFVIGGRAFTSQVMQKNCTEFIAYENVMNDPSTRAESRGERGRQQRQARGDRQPRTGTLPIEQAVPLVKRALKVLIDREVSPQLGLLKSTLLQLDSSFSERDYGVSTFREFADKLAEQGLVALKHQGRSTLVEMTNGHVDEAPTVVPDADVTIDHASSLDADRQAARELLEQPDSGPGLAELEGARRQNVSLADGVALVRKVLAEAAAPPRWPMYPRQFKQFLRNAQPDFDEKRYGSIADLMRACQKDGLLRLERDRQGGLRVFSNGAGARASVRHGWGLASDSAGEAATADQPQQEPPIVHDEGHQNGRGPVAEAVAEELPPPVVDAQVTEVIDEPAPAAPVKAKRATRSRKTAAKTPRNARTAKTSRARARE